MMRRTELNERSPLRVLEQSIHGGLAPGEVGVVVARHGVGKTAFLVGVALDDLMRDRSVLHVALDQSVDRVRTYYDEIFQELAHAEELENVWKVRADIERNRRIHSYLGGTFSLDKLGSTVEFLGTHTDFRPRVILIDGLDFENVSAEDLAGIRALAGNAGAELWMSSVTHREAERNDRDVPEPLASLEGSIDVILSMAHDGEGVHVRLLKDHGNPDVPELSLALDPTTMLLVKR